MLDINLVRENPKLVEESLRKRQDKEKVGWLKDLVEKDKKWRSLKQEIDKLRQKKNQLSKSFSKENLKEAKKLSKNIKEKEEAIAKLREKIQFYLMRLPNILHESVPKGKGEEDNVVIKKHGKPKKPSFPIQHHGQLAASLNIADFERAVKISGNGFFFLKGELALLDLALQRLALDLLAKDGFTPIQPPLLMRRKPYEGATDLADFEEVMYKGENEDLYLIATSEHPMAAMYQGEILEEKDLPITLAGVSPCFRREVGKHGLDERGLFRVHQFNKVEQFVFCEPRDSWEWHERLLKNAETFLKKLEIPYTVSNICTGDIGTVAAKKYDVNGWSPREKKYIELMSCANCTSYQATRLGIKFRKKSGEKEFVHTLNSTMVATTRTLRCVLENYQTKKGTVKVPKALQKYMNGVKEIKGK
jgi:seryl-tRNA synthetase